ncbi:MAG: heavy metal-binding domain-containing protein [candidate division Zixibacteria bacterium]|nr:heavy metal-binding domain-containing protein [candidate division Zixibacteria bacterium]
MRQTCRLCGAERSYSDSFKEKLILTTAPSIEGYKVAETLEIVTAECVFGVNVFRDFFGGISDFFGGRSAATQKVLRKARRVCLNELNKEAALVGADAVIAVKLDYSEFSGKGKSMLFLVASGTAVKIEKITEGTRAVKHG